MCVAVQDHHCAFINACVGYKNYRFFLQFLVSTMTLCLYGSYLVYWISSAELTRLRLRANVSMSVKWLIISARDPILVGLGLFAFLVGLLVFVFLVFQIRTNLLYGMTTNESYKWQDLAHAIKTGEVSQWSKNLQRYNQQQRSPSKREKKVFKPDSRVDFEDSVPLTSVSQIRNIYHRGIVGNLRESLFPRSVLALPLPPIAEDDVQEYHEWIVPPAYPPSPPSPQRMTDRIAAASNACINAASKGAAACAETGAQKTKKCAECCLRAETCDVSVCGKGCQIRAAGRVKGCLGFCLRPEVSAIPEVEPLVVHGARYRLGGSMFESDI
ncbi:MAG: hypothetical protein SGCHY_003784 [Lobulomycetales sp.]